MHDETAVDPGFWRTLGSRRMCRDFEPTELSPDLVSTVARAAFRGPSAGNTAGLDLLVLTDGGVDDYWDVTLPADRRNGFRWPGLLSAPVLIIPVVDPEAYVERYGRDDKSRTGLGGSTESWPVPYWSIDGGAAVMSILLAAEALGLGALFFGQFEHESGVRDRFGIPDGRRALGTIAIGYATSKGRTPSVSAKPGRPSWTDHTFTNRWGDD